MLAFASSNKGNTSPCTYTILMIQKGETRHNMRWRWNMYRFMYHRSDVTPDKPNIEQGEEEHIPSRLVETGMWM